jgi:hypothetical protein
MPWNSPATQFTYTPVATQTTPCLSSGALPKEMSVVTTTQWDGTQNYLWGGVLNVGNQYWYGREYRLKFTSLGPDMDKVEVFRATNTVDWSPGGPGSVAWADEPTPYAVGYCRPSTDTDVVSVRADVPSTTLKNETVLVTLKLRPTAQSSILSTSIQAVVRSSHPN